MLFVGLLTNMMLLNNHQKSNACRRMPSAGETCLQAVDVICNGNKSTPYHQRLVLVGDSGEFSPFMLLLETSVRARLD